MASAWLRVRQARSVQRRTPLKATHATRLGLAFEAEAGVSCRQALVLASWTPKCPPPSPHVATTRRLGSLLSVLRTLPRALPRPHSTETDCQHGSTAARARVLESGVVGRVNHVCASEWGPFCPAESPPPIQLHFAQLRGDIHPRSQGASPRASQPALGHQSRSSSRRDRWCQGALRRNSANASPSPIYALDPAAGGGRAFAPLNDTMTAPCWLSLDPVARRCGCASARPGGASRPPQPCTRRTSLRPRSHPGIPERGQLPRRGADLSARQCAAPHPARTTKRMFVKNFCWPNSMRPSHVTATTPGSIHEGGELGYALGVAYGAVMDKRDLIAFAVIGDGEAETGPTATAWHAHKFIDPAESDGRWAAGRGLVPQPPGAAARRCALAPGSHQEARGLAEVVPAPDVVRTRGVKVPIGSRSALVVTRMLPSESLRMGQLRELTQRSPDLVDVGTGGFMVDSETSAADKKVQVSAMQQCGAYLAALIPLNPDRAAHLFSGRAGVEQARCCAVARWLQGAQESNGIQPPVARGSSMRCSICRTMWRACICHRMPTVRCRRCRTACAGCNYVNLVVGSKHPNRVFLGADEANRHCKAGASIWHAYSNDKLGNPDVVIVGMAPRTTAEAIAATELLKGLGGKESIRARFVNVTDHMVLSERSVHPHALDAWSFQALFTTEAPVLFNFHGYPMAGQGLVGRSAVGPVALTALDLPHSESRSQGRLAPSRCPTAAYGRERRVCRAADEPAGDEAKVADVHRRARLRPAGAGRCEGARGNCCDGIVVRLSFSIVHDSKILGRREADLCASGEGRSCEIRWTAMERKRSRVVRPPALRRFEFSAWIGAETAAMNGRRRAVSAVCRRKSADGDGQICLCLDATRVAWQSKTTRAGRAETDAWKWPRDGGVGLRRSSSRLYRATPEAGRRARWISQAHRAQCAGVHPTRKRRVRGGARLARHLARCAAPHACATWAGYEELAIPDGGAPSRAWCTPRVGPGHHEERSAPFANARVAGAIRAAAQRRVGYADPLRGLASSVLRDCENVLLLRHALPRHHRRSSRQVHARPGVGGERIARRHGDAQVGLPRSVVRSSSAHSPRGARGGRGERWSQLRYVHGAHAARRVAGRNQVWDSRPRAGDAHSQREREAALGCYARRSGAQRAERLQSRRWHERFQDHRPTAQDGQQRREEGKVGVGCELHVALAQALDMSPLAPARQHDQGQ
ncbi:hypothetical protein L1887_58607 [Cichorium endivia]|nr:hypothetical protein L1887_58607 [Cichorium endivia]